MFEGGHSMWGIIATWTMAKDSVTNAAKSLEQGNDAGNTIVQAIKEVEDFPYYKSVGFGGLPNEDGVVELDAGYMDGDSLGIGAVMALQDIANPILVAKDLSKHSTNSILTGTGAKKYATENHFEEKQMLSDRAMIHYRKRKKELKNQEIKPYDGHDTVGMVCLDTKGKITSATSTSGLFMKKSGRLGDSPIVGSGFYSDSDIGGASATGLGEDLMKGCISYEIVRLMKEGKHPQVACEIAVQELHQRLIKRRGNAGDLSVVAMDIHGQWGVATNIDGFSFVVATSNCKPTVYQTRNIDGKCAHNKASQQWLEEYMQVRMAPLKE